jgi:hypothetical protein
VRDLVLSLRVDLSCCASEEDEMEGVGCTRNMNSGLYELDHLHLTFGRVQAALTDLGTETQMDYDNWVCNRYTGRAL